MQRWKKCSELPTTTGSIWTLFSNSSSDALSLQLTLMLFVAVTSRVKVPLTLIPGLISHTDIPSCSCSSFLSFLLCISISCSCPGSSLSPHFSHNEVRFEAFTWPVSMNVNDYLKPAGSVSFRTLTPLSSPPTTLTSIPIWIYLLLNHGRQ